MAINPQAAFSTGDLMRRLAQAESDITALQTERRLPSSSIGSGGLRIQGGRLLAEDASGEDVFEVTTEPPSIFMRQELVSDVATAVFSEKIHADTDPTTGTVIATSFGDLTGPDVGPRVLGVPVTTGKMVIALSFRADIVATEPGGGLGAADMSADVIGPSSQVAAFGQAAKVSTFISQGQTLRGQASITFVLIGLDSGSYDVTAKYAGPGSFVGHADIFDRHLSVIAL